MRTIWYTIFMIILFEDKSHIKLDANDNVRYGKFFFNKRMNESQVLAYLLYARQVEQLKI